jgi:hypothetical protein
MTGHRNRGAAQRLTHRRNLLRGGSVGYGVIAREEHQGVYARLRGLLRKRPDEARLTHPTVRTPHTKNPGAVSRPGTLREFQFPEYRDSMYRVKGNKRPLNLLPNLAAA